MTCITPVLYIIFCCCVGCPKCALKAMYHCVDSYCAKADGPVRPIWRRSWLSAFEAEYKGRQAVPPCRRHGQRAFLPPVPVRMAAAQRNTPDCKQRFAEVFGGAVCAYTCADLKSEQNPICLPRCVGRPMRRQSRKSTGTQSPSRPAYADLPASPSPAKYH